MKKMLIAGVIGAAFMATTPVLAAPAICPAGTYTVVKGDTLDDLSDGEWQKAEQINMPRLEGRRRKMANNKIKILIYPGECLYGIEKVNGTLVLSDGNVGGNQTTAPLGQYVKYTSWALIALLVLAALAFIAYLVYLRRELVKDPVTSGPPQRPGGESIEQVQHRFAEQGRRQGFRVVSVIPGIATGVMYVGYGNQDPMPRRLQNDRVYQMRLENLQGRPLEDQYSLQACGNDIRSGWATTVTGENFNFVPDVQEQPAPAPTPEVVPVPEPLPAAVNDAVSMEAQAEVPTDDQPAFFHKKGKIGERDEFSYNPDRVTVKITRERVSIWVLPEDASKEVSTSTPASTIEAA